MLLKKIEILNFKNLDSSSLIYITKKFESLNFELIDDYLLINHSDTVLRIMVNRSGNTYALISTNIWEHRNEFKVYFITILQNQDFVITKASLLNINENFITHTEKIKEETKTKLITLTGKMQFITNLPVVLKEINYSS